MLHILIVLLTIFCMYNYSQIYAQDKFLVDQDLKLELVTGGLKFPTSIAFLDKDDILVLEKEGMVKRVVNNKVLQEPVLDITSVVNSTRERGLLGIAISEDEVIYENNTTNKNLNIFLFYSEHKSDREITNIDCTPEKCDTDDLVVNSLYKYKFDNGKLVNPELLLYVPLDSHASLIHLGGIITVGPDNNIYISTGDGNLCRKYEDCKNAISNGLLNAQTANKENGKSPVGIGGILYVNVNGNITNYKPILGNEYPLNLYYAYGIRNSFGLDFDPVTGHLWDTENGPFYGDEINLVEPGFNSGWAKRMGIWSITDYDQLAVDPLPGEKRGYHFSEESQSESNKSKFLDFNGKGKYSDPELTWNYPVGVTSVEFFNSDKFGKKYENDLFIATFNDGLIYHFELDEERKNLVLKGKLKDKVADTNKELRNVIFAENLTSITDLETGPDGFLYVVSPEEGKIWRIVPVDKSVQ